MRVCVFAGARGDSNFVQLGHEAGQALAKAGHTVVYGGSSRGVMGGLAKGMTEQRGDIIGVLPERIARLKHSIDEDRTIVTRDMNSRKEHFWACDSFLMLPGGVGTYNELFEYWTLAKLGYITPRPCVVLNHGGYYDLLQAISREMVAYGFNTEQRRGLITFVDTLEEAMAALVPSESDAPETD